LVSERKIGTMKTKYSIVTALSIALVAVAIVGCKEEQTPATPATPISTNAVPNTMTDVLLPDIKDMQLALTTGLSYGQKAIALGRGLYYFNTAGDEAFDVIASYLRANTNLAAVAVFPAGDNYSNGWYVGDTTIDVHAIPNNLSVSNGTFAVFRDR
jgi:hypothetical protein